MKEYIALIAAALLLAASAGAVKVGVVVDYPDGETYVKCIEANEGDDGYSILQKTGLSIAWSTSLEWGHGLCGIEGVGCGGENCWCTEKYWGFYVKHQGEDAWTYSPVGFDAGSSCSEHYCAKDGDVLAFAYGTYGTKPQNMAYDEVCGEKLSRKKYMKGFSITAEPENIHAGEEIEVTVLDGYGGTVEYATLEAYAGTAGTTHPTVAAEILNGTVSFILKKEGDYTLRVTARDYRPNQEYAKITVQPKQTTTTSVTSTQPTEASSTTSRTSTTAAAVSSSSTLRTTTSAPVISSSSSTTIAAPAATGRATSFYGYAAVWVLLIIAAAVYLRG